MSAADESLDEVFDASTDVNERWIASRDSAPSAVRSLLGDGITDDLWWALFDAAPVAYGLINTETGEIYANLAAHRLFGYEPGEMQGMSVSSVIYPADAEFSENRDRLEHVAGTRFEGAKRYVRKDGSWFWAKLVASVLRQEDGHARVALVAVEDMTDAVATQVQLESSEARFRHLMENISDTVTLMDANAKVVLSTGNLRTILGFPTDFWDDVNLFDLVHPDDKAAMEEALVELLSEPGKELAGEARVRNAKGEWIDAEINAVNLLDDPAVEGIVLTTRNITARKQHEVELANARDQAVRALEMRTEFIASVSHELRTPIHGVLGLAELLVTADLDEEARNLARSISRATESLRMVLDDILDFSKMEVGRLEINREPVRPEEIGHDLQALFGAQARAKGIELEITKSDDLPEWVLSDGLRARQVLNNLVSNAIKFTYDGQVRVDARRVPAPEGAEVDEMIRVSVRDSGIGIPEEQFDRLFEPFSQAHQRTREFGGTGLGLSIARRLIELMGGELGFTSAIGEGSEFWFTVPLVEASAPAEVAAAPAPADADPQPLVSVMVVEDNPINQLLVRRQLERLGFAVAVYETGMAAIDAFADAPFDIVLMDWQLPGIDGLETTRRIRMWEAAHDRRPTPIVAMTASALPGDKTRCLEAGMDDFIAKPVSLATLGQVLQRWTHRRADDRPTEASPTEGGRDGSVLPEAAARDAIDRAVLDRLVEELADPMLVITVARTYLRELSGRVAAIDEAMQADDRPTLAAAAHTLKSTSAAVGAATLADLCLQIEQTARLSATVPLPVTRGELLDAVVRARAGLEHTVADLDQRVAGELPVLAE